jgi:hypothetical protein
MIEVIKDSDTYCPRTEGGHTRWDLHSFLIEVFAERHSDEVLRSWPPLLDNTVARRAVLFAIAVIIVRVPFTRDQVRSILDLHRHSLYGLSKDENQLLRFTLLQLEPGFAAHLLRDLGLECD